MTHEEALIRAFIVRRRRQRWLGLIGKPARKGSLRAHLAHCDGELDPRFATRVDPRDQNAISILQMILRICDESQCYVISENSAIDDRIMEIRNALEATVGGGMGTFLSIRKGQLAYYEGEDSCERYICRRKRQ